MVEGLIANIATKDHGIKKNEDTEHFRILPNPVICPTPKLVLPYIDEKIFNRARSKSPTSYAGAVS